MTLPRLNALIHHWQRHPPLHQLAAAWLGHGRANRPEPAESLLDLFADGRIR